MCCLVAPSHLAAFDFSFTVFFAVWCYGFRFLSSTAAASGSKYKVRSAYFQAPSKSIDSPILISCHTTNNPEQRTFRRALISRTNVSVHGMCRVVIVVHDLVTTMYSTSSGNYHCFYGHVVCTMRCEAAAVASTDRGTPTNP